MMPGEDVLEILILLVGALTSELDGTVYEGFVMVQMLYKVLVGTSSYFVVQKCLLAKLSE